MKKFSLTLKKMISELQKVQSVVNEISATSAIIDGASGLLNPTTVSTFSSAVKGLTAEQALLALSTKGLTDEQAKQVLVEAGLITSTDTVSVSTTSLTAANGTASVSFGVLTKAIWSNVAAIGAWLVSNPVGWLILAGAAIAGVVGVVALATTSLKEQKEKLEDVKTEYEDICSELDSVNEELDENRKLIDELNSKDKLTYVEQDQLSQLKEATSELELQAAILKEQKEADATKLGNENKKAFDKEFGDLGDLSEWTSDNYASLASSKKVTTIVPAIIKLQEDYNNELANGNTDIAKTIDDTIGIMTENLNNAEYQPVLTTLDEYKSNLLEIMDYRDLSDEEQKTYDSINEWQKEIFALTTPGSWNDAQISKIFNSSDLEATKDELIEMAQAGTLDEDTIKGYKNLNDAISESDLILSDGETALDSFINEIYALATAQEESISETESAAMTTEELADAYESLNSEIDSIQSAYSSLQDAVDEYNSQGYLSLDTLQSLIDLDDSYLACLVDENGQLSINEQSMAALTQAKLDAAEAAAVNQAMTELESIANGEYAQSTTDYVTGNANLVSSLATLSGSYDSVADAAMTAAQAQALSADIANASSVDSTATENVMSGLNAKLKLIQGTKSSISSGNFSTVASKSSSSSSSSGSSSSTDTWKEAFEAEYEALQHLHSMEQISDEQYYNSVNALNEKYFANNEAYTDEYTKYQEEVYSGLKDVYKDYVDNNTSLLKAQLEAGKISYQQYVSKVEALLNEMYSQGKISAEEYYEYVEDKLNEQLDIYDKVLSAVDTLLDNEMDKIQDSIDEIEDENDELNDQKDIYDSVISAVENLYDTKISEINDAIDALEDENDALSDQQDIYDSVLSAINEVYQDEIDGLTEQKDAIQDVIDAMSDENDERQRQIDLQTAQYNLTRAQNQNSQLVYQNGQMVYTNDSSAVKDYQNSVNDAQYAIDVAELQAQQDALDDAISVLEDYMNMWAAVADAYSTAQDEMNAKMVLGEEYAQMVLQNNITDIESFKNQYVEIQSQIDDNTELIDSYNEKSEYYSDLKEEWSNLSTAYENETNTQHASQLLGANWESELLAGRYTDLDNFKGDYLNIQSQIDDNSELVSSLEEKKSAYSDLKDQWDSITDALEDATYAQYAEQILGANWESDVLSGRIDTLTSFKNNYVSLQQAIADAAVNSANAQVEAAKNAAAAVTTDSTSVGSTSSGTSSGSSSGTTTGTTTSSTETNKYWVYRTLGSYSTNGEATSKISSLGGDGVIKVGSKYCVVKWLKGYSTSGEASSQIGYQSGSGYYKRYKTGAQKILEDQLAITQDGGQELQYDASTGGLLTRLGEGDAVFTNKMTNNLWKISQMNPTQVMSSGLSAQDYSSFGNTNNSNTTSITIAPGAIVLNDVQDVNTLGNAIVTQLPNILNQKLNKMK